MLPYSRILLTVADTAGFLESTKDATEKLSTSPSTAEYDIVNVPLPLSERVRPEAMLYSLLANSAALTCVAMLEAVKPALVDNSTETPSTVMVPPVNVVSDTVKSIPVVLLVIVGDKGILSVTA